jgi:diadenosine tetraphosphate (Ap4A) HIT family hydrolase
MTSSDVKLIDCVFCRIARGDDDSVEVICAEKAWVAFFPLNPATLGHTLIIPRTHVPDLWQVRLAQGCDLMTAVIKVGRAIESAVTPEGMNLITSAGEMAEQTVFHLHMHLVPRWREDGFGRIWPKGKQYENVNLREIANRVRQACANVR